MRLIKVMKVRNKALEKINLIIQSGIRIITFGAGSGLFYYIVRRKNAAANNKK